MMSTASEMRFAWRGMDAEGKERHGKIIASDALSARASMRRSSPGRMRSMSVARLIVSHLCLM